MSVYRDPKSWLVFVVAGLATAFAWLSLINPGMAGLIELCGENGVFAYIAPWDGERLLGLGAMWCAMGVAMMVPCITAALVANAWRWRESYGFFTAALCHALGYFGVVLPLVLAAAGLEWGLESAGLLRGGSPPDHPAASALLVGAGLGSLAWRRRNCPWPRLWLGPVHGGVRHAYRHMPVLVAMITVQLAAGSMNLGVMFLLGLAMLALEFSPRALRHAVPAIR
ncbi:hypothetical protein [Devosia sp.]|uniref:hypothetical protein n=1 Tax=Devosia sp. TaxID=1871048 RepID=UPI001AD451E2|nr:hypothetical protein [Devosia sp.]MBN9335108.1 hypothetical protein [Devosia sp.]